MLATALQRCLLAREDHLISAGCLAPTLQVCSRNLVRARSLSQLPALMSLRDALYSEDVRRFISTVTGCGGLTDRVDMAASAYAQGSHLLCHDDVIGTRAVSFIIYLSDPEWSAEDGGALELYALTADSRVEMGGESRPHILLLTAVASSSGVCALARA
jgi:hypothetical protein